MNTTRQEQNTSPTYEAVVTAHRELMRYEARTGADWVRDGYSIQAAQQVVDAARATYRSAFTAYAVTR